MWGAIQSGRCIGRSASVLACGLQRRLASECAACSETLPELACEDACTTVRTRSRIFRGT